MSASTAIKTVSATVSQKLFVVHGVVGRCGLVARSVLSGSFDPRRGSEDNFKYADQYGNHHYSRKSEQEYVQEPHGKKVWTELLKIKSNPAKGCENPSHCAMERALVWVFGTASTNDQSHPVVKDHAQNERGHGGVVPILQGPLAQLRRIHSINLKMPLRLFNEGGQLC